MTDPSLSGKGGMQLRPAELINLHGQDTGRDALSHTRLGTFLACEERFRWQYIKRLEPAVKPEPLSRGAAFAHALELNNPQAGYDLVMEEQAALVEEHGHNLWISLPSEDDALRVATLVRAMSTAYLATYGTQGARREVTLRQVLRNPQTGAASRTFDVQARVDAVAGDLLIEDKTASRIPAFTQQRLKLDRQVTLGCYLLWRCEGIDVRDVSYRITRTPSIKQTQKETLSEYLDRLEHDYAERASWYCQEFELSRTPDDFVRLEQELWDWAAQIRDATRKGVWPRNVSSCAEYQGCRYLALCAREPGAEQQFQVRGERAA